jgi:hypothetical protein
MPSIIITPPHLIAGLLSEAEEINNLLLLDMRGDMNGNIWNVLLDLVFNSIDVPKTKGARKKYYHIACSSASLSIRVNQATITDVAGIIKLKQLFPKQ